MPSQAKMNRESFIDKFKKQDKINQLILHFAITIDQKQSQN